MPVASAPVAALAAIPAGPGLAAALADVDVAGGSGFEAVLVLAAQFRQANHERGLLMGAVVQVLRRKDAGHGVREGWHSGDLLGCAEVRAALVLTRPAAKDLCALARDLSVRLPAVLDALVRGVLDEARARIFSGWTAELCDEHATALVERLLPVAPRLTTAELIVALGKGAIELDPEWARRRYERALGERRVEGKLRPDGTADLCGYNLPAGAVAIACSRLDRLAHRLKQAGYPGRIDHIRAELYLGKLAGEFPGLDDDEIFDMLMTTCQPDWATDPTDSTVDGPAPTEPAQTSTSNAADSVVDHPAPAEPAQTSTSGDDRGDAADEPGGDGRADDDSGNGDRGDDPGGGRPPADGGPGSLPRGPGGAHGGARGGVRLLVGLSTLAGVHRRPGELLGWGFVHAELARQIAATPTASWYYALTRPDGDLLHVGSIRTRPIRPVTDRTPSTPADVQVWLQVSVDELADLSAHPPPGWEQVLADLTHRLATRPGGPPNGDPRGRLPSAALRRWIAIRDRHCTFRGCRVAPQRCDVDHIIAYAHGGPTADWNLAHACRADHLLRHTGGWSVQQPRSGTIIWTSPLGHTYPPVPQPGPMHALDPLPNPTTPQADPEDDEPIYSPHDTCTYDLPYPRHRTPTQPPPQPQPPPANTDEIPPF